MFTAGPQPQPSTPSVPCRTSTTAIHAQCLLPDLNHSHPRPVFAAPHSHPRPVFAAGPQPQPSTPSVRCRTSTTAIHAQCSLPDLNHSHPRPVFAAGPQPQPSTPSVRCRTSTRAIRAQCSLPDLNHSHLSPVFAGGPQPQCLMYIDECFQFAVGAEFGEIGLWRTETLSLLFLCSC